MEIVSIPKISVIVPIYNVEIYLDRCLQSLCRQSLQDIEIILVDDGSTDKCPQLCDDYAQKDNRIKVIHKPNAGLGYARNSGLEIATGEYIAFVDSDDFVDTDMYRILYSKAHERQLDVLFCGYFSYKNGQIIKSIKETEDYIEYKNAECQNVLLGMLFNCGNREKIVKYEMSVWHSIYKRDIIHNNNINFCSERVFCSEDIIFHIDLIKECKCIGFIPTPLYYYCYNDMSLSKKPRFDRVHKDFVLFQEIKNRIAEKEYSFDISKIQNLFLLKLRYDITIIASYNLSKEVQKKYIKEIICSTEFCQWIKKINWTDLPTRYIIFFVLVKFKMVTLLYYLINFK